MKFPWSRILLAAILVAAGVWGWRTLFPGPEKAIRASLAGLAQTASFGDEGTLAKAYYSQKLTGYFSTNVEVNVDIQGFGTQTLSGRDEIQQAALIARQRLRGLKVEFVDVHVTLSPDRQTAVANLTAKAMLVGQSDFSPQEMNISLRKVNGRWLVYRIETVKTLSRSQGPKHEDT